MKVLKQNLAAVAAATAALKRGEVIICPTDTVYGFLADASDKKAVEKIYKIKKRPKNKPLPVFVASIKMARELAEIDARQMKYLKKYWPGVYTFVLKRRYITNMEASKIVVYGVDKKSIAIRIPKNIFLQKLLKKINRPLVQTSVNLAGQEPLNSAEQIMATFGKNKLVGLIITSSKPLMGKSSQVIDLTTEKRVILRK